MNKLDFVSDDGESSLIDSHHQLYKLQNEFLKQRAISAYSPDEKRMTHTLVNPVQPSLPRSKSPCPRKQRDPSYFSRKEDSSDGINQKYYHSFSCFQRFHQPQSRQGISIDVSDPKFKKPESYYINVIFSDAHHPIPQLPTTLELRLSHPIPRKPSAVRQMIADRSRREHQQFDSLTRNRHFAHCEVVRARKAAADSERQVQLRLHSDMSIARATARRDYFTLKKIKFARQELAKVHYSDHLHQDMVESPRMDELKSDASSFDDIMMRLLQDAAENPSDSSGLTDSEFEFLKIWIHGKIEEMKIQEERELEKKEMLSKWQSLIKEGNSVDWTKPDETKELSSTSENDQVSLNTHDIIKKSQHKEEEKEYDDTSTKYSDPSSIDKEISTRNKSKKLIKGRDSMFYVGQHYVSPEMRTQDEIIADIRSTLTEKRRFLPFQKSSEIVGRNSSLLRRIRARLGELSARKSLLETKRIQKSLKEFEKTLSSIPHGDKTLESQGKGIALLHKISIQRENPFVDLY
ncbi:hypothetical protein ADUPG1_009601 [Aduncisulcus paluster]|uniref:Uncharacterized protein n=1 Tax=Aduncisulcus paluster TaxID=2918883 RepID=A0ABQ5KYY6_9EUKA|nr:hypothetical protein ADUPG1_009601 [Aduncisulcus paluster]